MTWSDRRVPHSQGFLPDVFRAVGDAFAQNFEEGAEIGANFAVVIDGKTVLDIRGGFTDRKKETPWAEDTIACIFSSSKAVLTFLVAREVSAGRLDYDTPVAEWWPDFGAAGKESVTLGQAMSHQAGLCGIPDEMAPSIWLDWDAITAKIAAMEPLWPPGLANGYHPQTVGFIVGEVLRRVTGQSAGALIADIAEAHGLSIYCGLRPREIARTVFMQKPSRPADLGPITDFKRAAFLKPWSAPARVAHEDWMAAEIPASNMHADAQSLAKIVHPLANRGRDVSGEDVLTAAAIDAALEERIRGEDLVLPFELSWSAGLMRNINRSFGPNERAYGHAGSGGSCVLIDPENNLTAAYVMNKMSPYLVGDPRAVRLLDALYASL